MTLLEELHFQKLDYPGLKTLVQWAEEEGWNPGPKDAEVYWETDPDGFYGYYLKDELIAGGSIVSYNGEFGFMGFFIVKPKYRALGIGRKLWHQRRDTLLARLHKGAAIGMDGVIDMQPFYQKGGFEIAFRDERHEKIGEEFTIHPNISKITDDDLDSILAYDLDCFGFNRSTFIKAWLKLPDNRTFKYQENGEFKGFAIVRKANTGYKICPLFANNTSIAEELYKACLNSAIGESVYLDIPLVNENAVSLTKKYNTTYVFECARMYLGNPPQNNIQRTFGITTFELG